MLILHVLSHGRLDGRISSKTACCLSVQMLQLVLPSVRLMLVESKCGRAAAHAHDASRTWRQADETDDPDAAYSIRSAWKVVDRVIAERLVDADSKEQAAAADKKPRKGSRKDEEDSKADAKDGDGGHTGSGLRRREFLVKWRELQYDACTWESEADLAAWGADAEVARFRALEPIQDSAQARQVRRRFGSLQLHAMVAAVCCSLGSTLNVLSHANSWTLQICFMKVCTCEVL